MHLKPWPYSQIKEPRPADWSIGMTVCIAVECFSEALICVTDSMLSTADMSADKIAIKSFAVANTWLCMFAANDISPVTSIRNSVISEIEGDVSLKEIVLAFQSAFRKEIIVKAESTILAPLGMDMADFRHNGLANFGPEIFSRLFYQIEQLSIDVTFLICGFSEGEPHIFSIKDRGEVSYFDQPGFWAIGSGQTNALGALFSHEPSVKYRKLPDSIYIACKAKFLAESAPGVGSSTLVVILIKNGGRKFLYADDVAKLKDLWKASKPPDIPEGASEQVEKLIKEREKETLKRSTSETSTQGQ